MRKTRTYLIGILILAFVLRVLLVIIVRDHLERAIEPDTPGYIEPALRLIHGQGFIDDPHRTPVYPLFIASIYWVTSEKPLAVIIVQIFLSVLTVLMIYWLGKRLLSESVGLIAAFLMAVSIEAITHSFFLLTETLFTFLFFGSILAFVLFDQSHKRIWLITSGLLMGIAILCRPIAFYFPVLFLLIVLFRSANSILERILKSIIYGGCVFLVLLPWILWNYSTIGLATVTTISDYNLLFYNAALLRADQTGQYADQVRDQLADQVDQTLTERNLIDTPANRSAIDREIALKIISGDPVRYGYLHLKSDLNNLLPGVTGLTEILGITVGGKGTLSVLNKDGLLAAIRFYFADKVWLLGLFAPAIALLVVTYLADLIGAGRLVKDRKWFILCLLFIPLLYLMLIPGAPSNQRFRVPALPYINLLAAEGLLVTWRFIGKFINGIKNKSGKKYESPAVSA
jgi:4-amino-4-deoxy-L-arabinose transferase-like glycosyltransferase